MQTLGELSVYSRFHFNTKENMKEKKIILYTHPACTFAEAKALTEELKAKNPHINVCGKWTASC